MLKKGFMAAAVLAATMAALPGAADAKDYEIDEKHTTVKFRVRHLFTYVEGTFSDFEGKISFDLANPEATKVSGTIKVASIDTNVDKRDKHLLSSDFFAADSHPEITFESTKVTDVDAAAKTAKIHGKLSIRGNTRDVVLDVGFTGEGQDPWGNKKAGFTARTKINRKDFGLNWNETLETGGVLVGEEVEIQIDAEADFE